MTSRFIKNFKSCLTSILQENPLNKRYSGGKYSWGHTDDTGNRGTLAVIFWMWTLSRHWMSLMLIPKITAGKYAEWYYLWADGVLKWIYCVYIYLVLFWTFYYKEKVLGNVPRNCFYWSRMFITTYTFFSFALMNGKKWYGIASKKQRINFLYCIKTAAKNSHLQTWCDGDYNVPWALN